MGHTVTSQRMLVDIALQELKEFSRALRKEERMLLDKILLEPLKHTGSISNACSMDVWALILLSIVLEQEKRLLSLESKYDRLADRLLSD